MTTEPRQPFDWIAAALGWVVPGLGHFRVGEKRRGRLVMGGVLGLFLAGVLVGGIDAVDRHEDGLWFVAQAGAGPVAFVFDVANSALLKTGRFGELLDVPPVSGGALPKVSSYKGMGHVAEYGTLFTALAGLMNVVAMLDAGSRRRAEGA